MAHDPAALERAYPSDDSSIIDHTARVLLQLHAVDPTSEDARYPIRVDGSPTLTTVSCVHIGQFHEAMAGVAHFLDARDCGLRVKLDERAEYEADMASWYPTSCEPTATDVPSATGIPAADHTAASVASRSAAAPRPHQHQDAVRSPSTALS